MAEIDKNPRQITRLRVEDQAKLEKLASVTGFDESDNTPQFDSLYVDGSLVANNLYLYETIDFPGSASLKYSEEDSEFIFSNAETEFNVHLPLSQAEEEILTDKSVKTLFGNKSIYGSGNIDLYVHYLNISTGNIKWTGVVYSSNNIIVNSPQKLTTLLKATNTDKNYIVLHGQDGQSGLLYWGNSIWQVDIDGQENLVNVISVSDRVETI